MTSTVLIVEDHSEDRRLLRFNFDRQGYRVLEAANGRQALALAEAERPDLIVSDALMPEMDGFQLLREIKKRPELCATPFIFYSSVYTGGREKELALTLGARAFIVKPLAPDQLWDELTRVLLEAVPSGLSGALVSCSDEAFLNDYSRIVAAKLEEKVRELEAANRRIARTEARYRNLFASMRDLVIISDLSRTIIDANQPALRTILGYEAEEIVGRSTALIYAEQSQFELAGKEVFNRHDADAGKLLEIRFRRKSGEVFVGEMFALKMRGDGGEPVANFGVIRDITEHKKLEMQYLHAQKMESVGTLAGGVAHDFNNILTAIAGFVHVTLTKMAADDPLRRNIDQILVATDRAATLTRELLLFSRKQHSERRPVDLNEVLLQMETFLQRTLGADIALQTVPHSAPLTVMADPNQLQQVLMNLAVNAHDAMPQGGTLFLQTAPVALHEDFISAHGYGQPGPYALLTVADSGLGMDKATLERIFEPFFTTKQVGKGTGLGLAVVYGVVKQHEGFITAYSEPGQGSTFRIYLPLTGQAATRIRGPEPPGGLASGGTETILLAEDDQMVRELLQRVLNDAGYQVIVAVDGEDALRRFQEHADSIQLLLFDLIMAKMNGKEAYDRICGLRPGLKVIFSSGYAPEMVRQKARLDANCHLVPKPVAPNELLQKVREVLDGAK